MARGKKYIYFFFYYNARKIARPMFLYANIDVEFSRVRRRVITFAIFLDFVIYIFFCLRKR